MKKLLTAAALSVAALVSMPAHALTATGGFDVSINLFPRCIVAFTGGTTLTLNYVSFQSTQSQNTLGYSVQCTNTLPYTMALSNTALTALALNYSLAVPAGGTGSGAAQAYNITGTIAANQGGDCSQANTGVAGSQVASVTGTATGLGTACTATSAAQTLTITY